ncbi:MAG TPA: hypothetical protein VF678_00625 [bacterium]
MLVVMPFDGIGVAVGDATTLTGRVQDEVAATRRFTLVDRGPADEFMKERAFRQEPCTGVPCAQQLGRSLGVELVLSGALTQQDGHWHITAELVEVASGKSTPIDPVDQDGDIRQMLDRAPVALAAKLAQLTVSGPQPVEPPSERPAPRPLRDMGSSDDAMMPRNGFALYTGYALYSGRAKMADGSTVTFRGQSVPSLGLEYQWALSSPWSLALLLELSGPSQASGEFGKVYTSGGPSEFALELRYWKDRAYLGFNVSSSQLCFFDFSENKKPVDELCFHGTSYGPAAGYQFRNGWFLSGSYNHADLSADERTDDIRVPDAKSATNNTLWLNAGYRWGQK